MKNSIFKKLFAFLTILLAHSSFSQNSEVKVMDLKPAFNDNKFPEVLIPTNLKAQNKINTFLQLKHLEHLPKIFKTNPYEKLQIDKNSEMYRTTFHNWSVNKTPKKILSIIIEAEFTMAYSEGYTIYENFDIQTGNKITVNNLLSKEGNLKLSKILNDTINLEIKNHLENLKQKNPANSDEKESIDMQTEIYQTCLENNQVYEIEFYNFTFTNEKITFFRNRCSNHADWAFDELDTFEISFTYKEIEKYLSDYGKSLCFTGSKETKSTSIDGKMFKGKIDGKYPITAVIKEISSENQAQIFYWYDKYNTPIEWIGKFEKNQFQLNEYNEGYHGISIEAKLINNKIIGSWKNKTTNKTLKLELSEY